jgi:four helix bundle protein
MDIALLAELAKWEVTVSPDETAGPLWKLHAYRVSRYLLDCCLFDIENADPPLHPQTSEQLRRAVASISANLAEGYSRRTPKDRLRFYAYALGSLREASVWYLTVRAHVSPALLRERLAVIGQLRRLVLGMHAGVSRTGGWVTRPEREERGK